MTEPSPEDPRGGETISHYRLLGRIGSGGMGVVYKAEDLKLGRLVALKFVSEDLAGNEDMRQRFEREARTASALNHPNICTIYEIDEAQGRLFLAMECLEGQSLDVLLRGGARPFDEVLQIGIDVAGALQAAHSRGICHRDIKPANIFITSDGTPKLLDFGLAKVHESGATDGQQVTEMVSSPGFIVGTAQYMSPEQAVGMPLDPRTDIFSLGLVLYEMATGQQAFAGATGTVLHAIITRQTPAPSTVSSNLPRQFDEIVAKALEKDREVRYQSAAELRADLRRLKRDLDGASRSAIQPAVPPPRRWSARSVAGAAALALLAVAFTIRGTLWWTPRESFPLEGARFSQVTGQAGIEHFPSLSPDGNTLVYAGVKDGSYDIFLQRVDGQRAINLTVDSPESDTQPVFSPEGDRIAFRSERDGGGLFVMGATGESVRRVSDAGYNPTWSPDGRALAYATESVETAHSRMGISSVWVVDVATGHRRKVSDDDAVQPSWSPNGHRIAYWTVGDRAQRDIRTIPAEGGASLAVTDDAPTDWSPAWSPDGRYLFFASDRGGSMNLWRVRVDERTGRTLAAPEPVTTPSVNSGQITISRDGSKLAYVSQSFARNIARIPFDLEKREAGQAMTPVVQGTRFLRFPSVSPDGASIAYTSEEKIFVARSDGSSSPTQLTEGAAFRDRAPRWSNDGKRIAFYSDRSGSYEIWAVERDGGGLTQVTEQRDSTLFYPVWSPDGRRIAYGSLDARSAHLLEVGTPWSRQRPVLLPPPPAAGTVFAPWSWSARAGLAGWALAADGESLGILISDPAAGTMRQVTTFGARPVWLPDDRHLVALHGNRLFVADARDGSSRWIATPQSLEEDFAMSPDGRWIYFVDDRKEGDIWLATLPAGRRIQE